MALVSEVSRERHPHYSKEIACYSVKIILGRILPKGLPINWKNISPDLTPSNFRLLLGHFLIERAFANVVEIEERCLGFFPFKWNGGTNVQPKPLPVNDMDCVLNIDYL
ncbi:hypothetical protein Trydic_g21852 [Trypoxylus dichotomus]